MITSSRYLSILLAVLLLLTFNSCLEVPDEGPPATTILNPAPQEVVAGDVPVLVTAVDDKGVKEIKVFIDGVPVASFDGDNGTYIWDTQPQADNQDHHVVAYSTDEEDNIGPSAITSVRVTASLEDTLAPVVSILSPVGGQAVPLNANVIIFVNATDASSISTVEIFVDGDLLGVAQPETGGGFSINWNTTGLLAGTQHTLFARATDGGGFVGFSATTQVVISNTAPLPAPGDEANRLAKEKLAPEMRGVKAGASYSDKLTLAPRFDADMKVAEVRYSIDGEEVARSNQAPFDAELDLNAFADGQDHGIYVEVFYQSGNKSARLIPIIITD